MAAEEAELVELGGALRSLFANAITTTRHVLAVWTDAGVFDGIWGEYPGVVVRDVAAAVLALHHIQCSHTIYYRSSDSEA